MLISGASDALLNLGAHVATGGAQLAYLEIPAATLRGFSDSLFPGFAKDAVADIVSGSGHRFMAGHDLLLDVVPRFASEPVGAFHQAGHILLTDFPTKAGIPIPGFSHSGLGQYLVDCGIPKGWMCLNIMDAGVGLLAIGEGSADLMAALSGDLPMNAWTFFDTYVQGSVELLAGVHLQNPLLLGAGIENVTAGVVSAWNTYTYQVPMEKFFGYSLTGALVGLGLAYLFGQAAGIDSKTTLSTAGRGAILGGLSAVSKYFSMGTAMGLLAFQIGKYVAERQNRTQLLSSGTLSVLLKEMDSNPIQRDIFEARLSMAFDFFAENAPFWKEECERRKAITAHMGGSALLEEEKKRIQLVSHPAKSLFANRESESRLF